MRIDPRSEIDGIRALKIRDCIRRAGALLKRVEGINKNQSYLHMVAYVGVFGSYLSDSATINDLDIAFSFKRRDVDSELFMKRIAEKVRKEKKAGRRFSSYLDELYWPELEVLRALKGRSAAISLHSTDDEILQRTPVRDLYRLPEH